LMGSFLDLFDSFSDGLSHVLSSLVNFIANSMNVFLDWFSNIFSDWFSNIMWSLRDFLFNNI
jgi:hypothetical protein